MRAMHASPLPRACQAAPQPAQPPVAQDKYAATPAPHTPGTRSGGRAWSPGWQTASSACQMACLAPLLTTTSSAP